MDEAVKSSLEWRPERSRPANRTLALGLALLAGIALWPWRDVPYDWLDAELGNRPLMHAASWHYQLDKVDVDALSRVQADVLVTDAGGVRGREPLSATAVDRLKINPDGRARIVLAYLSIGEAEEFRYYFDPAWKAAPPSWLGPENCSWPEAHKVRFWHDEWRDIAYRGARSYLARVIEAGFDGVYLDRVDIYSQWETERPTARADMIAFVIDLAETARRAKPGFLVVPQNADDLLDDHAYRRAIDGLGREDLLYGVHGTGKRNPEVEIARAVVRLARLRWNWKPVLAVEYLQDHAAIEHARTELTAGGYVPTFQPRALDGADPTAPSVALEKDTGSAEYTARRCTGDNSW